MLRKILIISCLCLPLLSFSKKKKKQPPVQQTTAVYSDYRQLNAPLPEFRVQKIDGKVITNRTVQNDANLFIMMFNPTCEHCEEMTGALEKNISLFRKSKVVMIAASTMGPYLGDFEKQFKVEKYPTLMVGLDSSKLIDKLFNYNTLPQINIYNHDRRLIRVFNAIESVDSLKQYIE